MDHPILLTPKERESLIFIISYIAEHGYAPSINDVADAAHVAATVGRSRVAALMAKGYIRRDVRRSRTMVVLRNEDGHDVEPPHERERAS